MIAGAVFVGLEPELDVIQSVEPFVRRSVLCDAGGYFRLNDVLETLENATRIWRRKWDAVLRTLPTVHWDASGERFTFEPVRPPVEAVTSNHEPPSTPEPDVTSVRESPKPRPAVDYGWIDDGAALWLECRLTATNCRRGSVRVPAAIRDQLAPAAYAVRNRAGKRFGAASCNQAGDLTGLGDAFAAHRVQPGTRVRLTFHHASLDLRFELPE